MLCLLNNGANSLDHLITFGMSFGDHSGFNYKGDSSSTKIVFIKSRLLVDSIISSNYKPVIKFLATKVKSVLQQAIVISQLAKFLM